MEIIKEILYWTWCLPQTLLGLIVKWIYNGKGKHTLSTYNLTKDIKYCLSNSLPGGISLGKYIILNVECDDTYSIKHEYGHQIQSFILGPLYLLVIGLPSLIWCWFIRDYVNDKRRLKGKNTLSYYWFYTEKWANKLAKLGD